MPDEQGLPTNKDRAEWAAKALKTVDDDRVCDLLANLMHYCDANGVDFEEELERARRTYGGDLEEEKKA